MVAEAAFDSSTLSSELEPGRCTCNRNNSDRMFNIGNNNLFCFHGVNDGCSGVGRCFRSLSNHQRVVVGANPSVRFGAQLRPNTRSPSFNPSVVDSISIGSVSLFLGRHTSRNFTFGDLARDRIQNQRPLGYSNGKVHSI